MNNKMIRVEKFHPRDEIGSSHIEVKFDAKFAHIRHVSHFGVEKPQFHIEHFGSLHRVIKTAQHAAHKNGLCG